MPKTRTKKSKAMEPVRVPAVTVPKRLTSREIEHPHHYNRGEIEVWDAIVDWELGYLEGNVVKYVARAGHKEGQSKLKDLHKARAYIERAIEALT